MAKNRVFKRAPGMRFALAVSLLIAGGVSFGPGTAEAADEIEMTMTLKDHKFEPAEIKVQAGKAIKLTINNLDDDMEEFDSKALRVEKIIAPKGTAIVRIRPLAKGSYPFMGEFHDDTAQGTVIAE
jgi:hypothetical protein